MLVLRMALGFQGMVEAWKDDNEGYDGINKGVRNSVWINFQ